MIIDLCAISSTLYAVILSRAVVHVPSLQKLSLCADRYTSMSYVPTSASSKQLHLHLLHSRLLAEAERLIAAVESNQLSLEHGVAIDLKTSTLVALDTTEAGGVSLVDGGEGDLVTGDLGHVGVADGDGHVGESGATWVDVTSDLGVELSALDLGVVGVGDLLIDEEQRCAGVSNGVGALGVLEHLITNGELGGGKLPEAGLSLDRDPCHLTLELGSIDLAELVHTGAIGVKISSENGHVEIVHDIVEESLLGSLLGTVVDSVKVGESKTDEAISVGVLDKRLRDGVGQLDGLALDLNTSDSDSVSTNGSGSTGAVTVADLPLSTLSLLESSRLGSIECSVLANRSGVKLSAKHPPK